jgi:hypothetical protein
VDSNIRGPHVENLHDGHRIGAFGAALLGSAAFAAPLNATTIGYAEVSNVDQIGLVCNSSKNVLGLTANRTTILP